MNQVLVIVRREEPISGVAMQPEYNLVLPASDVPGLETALKSTKYYVDDVVPLTTREELLDLI